MATAPPRWTATSRSVLCHQSGRARTPLMNQTDATTVMSWIKPPSSQLRLTGSFTQLAIMSPAFTRTSWEARVATPASATRPSSPTASATPATAFRSTASAHNLFNGNSTARLARIALSSTSARASAPAANPDQHSVYGAIGQALPTPPPEAIQEIAVNSAMYDATQGSNSGAHISVLTKSGGNGYTPRSTRSSRTAHECGAVLLQCLAYLVAYFLNRNHLGPRRRPIKKDKLFILSYQGVRIADSSDATKEVTVPLTSRTTAALRASSTPFRRLPEKRSRPSQPQLAGAELVASQGSIRSYLFPRSNPRTPVSPPNSVMTQCARAQRSIQGGPGNRQRRL